MKHLLPLIFALILTACGGSSDLSREAPSKPRLPRPPAKVDASTMQANLLGALRNKEEEGKKSGEDIGGLVNRINDNLAQKNITASDLEQGWYYGSEADRKWGTPSSWVWKTQGGKSYWASPDALEKIDDIETDQLCRETGGHFAISCIARDLPHCEHIPESVCRCAEEGKWMNGQGCIKTDEDGEPITISPEDIKNGSYSGMMSEKKLNTPQSWIWVDGGNASRWQNPSPMTK